MIRANQMMQSSDWKQRCEAALLTVATLTVKWSGEKAERKRLVHAMHKVRWALEKADDAIDKEEFRAAHDYLAEAVELTKFTTAGIGKKAAKKEGLVIE